MSWMISWFVFGCMGVLAVLLILVVVGLLIHQYITDQRDKPPDARLEDEMEPVDDELHEKKLQATRRGYESSMSKYDQLITWSAGGALLFSLTLVADFIDIAPPGSRYFLYSAWMLLVASIGISIFGQYKSTRIKVYSQEFQKARQDRPSRNASREAKDEWERTLRYYWRLMRRNQKLASMGNTVAPILLILGIALLVTSALLVIEAEAGPIMGSLVGAI